MEPNEIGYIEGDKVVYPFLKSRRQHERIKTPEEVVRLRFITSLVFQYQYPPQRIDIEVTVPRRTPEDSADIVIYSDDALKDTYIVIECKQDGLHEREKQQAIEQGFGNANSLRAPYLGIVCGDDEKFYDVQNFPPQERIKNRIPSLPVAYGKAPQYRYARGGEGWELKRIDLAELNRRFQRCHDAIWESGKRDPAQSFDEMSMLMVAKYYDENKTPVGGYYRFQIGTNEDAPMVASRIRRVFSESKGQNPSVFATSNITVSDQIVYRVVETLQDISLKDTDIDAKGRAFEKFLKLTFKGELGQYFTPLEIKDFMVEMVGPDEGDFVVDPACGSGGFLLGCMKHVRDKVKQRYAGDEMAVTKADWDFSHKHVWGADINDRIARVAMLGMILNEDGSSNIECHDSFSDFASFQRDDMFSPNRFSILLTNPPFGGDVFEPKILANFELCAKGNKKRKTQKTEILMLERCLELLKPGGRMGIVLPDGILTNSSLAYVREFVEERATLTAVISLPSHAFKPSADVGVKASLVFLRKKQYLGQEVGDYPIFMAMVEHVGYDATGRDDKNELPEVAEAFFGRSGRVGQLTDRPLSYQTRYSELKRRWDAYSSQPRLTTLVADLEKRGNIVALGSLITHIQYGASLKPKYASEGIPFLRITNLKPNEVDTSNIVHFPESERKAIGTCFVKEEDILISRSGTIGMAAAVPKEANGFAFGSYMIKFSVAKEVNPSYVAAFINSASGKAQIERASSGAVQTNITIPAIKGVKIPLPPRPIQDRIAQMMAEAYKERERLREEAEQVVATAKENMERILRGEQ